MKKHLVLFLGLILSYTVIDYSSFIGYSWSKKMVDQSLQSTLIVIKTFKDEAYLGSAVIIKADGTALTAAHVASSTSALVAYTRDGRKYNLRLLMRDRYKDLALVQPEMSAQHFKFCPIQKSNDLYIGQDVLIVGHPEGEFYTVTNGIITNLDYFWWVQCFVIKTNALVRPGNSGGGMFNTKGELIGIISAMQLDMFWQPTGIGVAISIKEIHKFLKKYEDSIKVFKQIKRHSIRELL